MTLSDERYREIANEAVNDYCDPEGRHLQAAFIHAIRQAVAESQAAAQARIEQLERENAALRANTSKSVAKRLDVQLREP